MISDKYIRQFYQFTKQSIMGTADSLAFEGQLSSQKFLYFTGVVLVLVIVTVLTHIRSAAIKDAPDLAIKPKIQSEPIYASEIPMFRVAATRQLVSAMPRRKAALIAFNEDSWINESLVVMDKVVVIPKVIS